MNAPSTSRDTAHAVATAQLLPLMCLLQQGHCEVASLQEQLPCAAVPGVATSSGRPQQHEVMVVRLGNSMDRPVHSLLDSLPALTGADAAPLQLCALQAVSRMLQASVGCLTATTIAHWLQDAADNAFRLQALREKWLADRRDSGSAQTVSREQDANLMSMLSHCIPPLLAPAGSHISQPPQQQLPALRDLASVLQPSLGNQSGAGATAHSTVQLSALRVIHSYLAVTDQPGYLTGSKALLLLALASVFSANNAVRDAALDMMQLYLHPAVLQEAFGDDSQQEQLLHSTDTDTPKTPQRRLLEHLQQLLEVVSATVGTDAQQQQGQPTRLADSVVAAKISLLRGITGLYGGLLGNGDEELPLLCLLEQQCPAVCPDDRVSSCGMLFESLHMQPVLQLARQASTPVEP